MPDTRERYRELLAECRVLLDRCVPFTPHESGIYHEVRDTSRKIADMLHRGRGRPRSVDTSSDVV